MSASYVLLRKFQQKDWVLFIGQDGIKMTLTSVDSKRFYALQNLEGTPYLEFFIERDKLPHQKGLIHLIEQRILNLSISL